MSNDEIIINYLVQIGLPTNLVGFLYIFDAIKFLINNSNYILNNGVYPYLSSKYNTNSVCIERDIRYAIKVNFNNNSKLNEMFGFSINYSRDLPSVKLYLMTISKLVNLILND